MFISIRKYRIEGSLDELTAKVEAEFVPILRGMPGFRGYQLLDCGGGQAASISMFDSRDSAMASNDRARDWVARSIAHMLPGAPEITAGETRIDVRA
jgi:hypothetical protein